MKNWGKRLLGAALCCACLMGAGALADGKRVNSRLFGDMLLASYVGTDGYGSADGYGGVTAADPYFLTVISKSASVWSEPRTNSKRIATVEHGDKLTGVPNDRGYEGGDNVLWRDGFYAVDYKGKQGWVNEDYVVRNTLEIVLMESNVPAYIAPDAHAKKVGSLSKLTRYRVIGFYDDYYIVNPRGAAAAFIPMSVRHYDTAYDAAWRQAPEHGGVTTAKTQLRCGPGKSYASIKDLPEGYEFSCVDEIDGWYLVRYDAKNTDGSVLAYIDSAAAQVEGW